MTPNKDIEKELNSISQTVANLSPKASFVVPEGYFESFPEDLMKKIREKETKDETGLFRLFKRKQVIRYMAAASVVGLLLSGGYFFFTAKSSIELVSTSLTTPKEAVSEDAMASYLFEMDEVSSPGHTEEVVFDESLLAQMDKKMVSSLLAELPETGIEQFMNERNSESYLSN